MSWDSYITNMEGEGCCFAGLFDLDGNPWAQSKSPMLAVTPQQVQHVIKGIKGSADLRGQGVMFGQTKFLVVILTDNLVVLKQLGGDSSNKYMVCVGLCNRCVVIGASTAGEKEKCSRLSVEKYAEYLRSLSY
jgi:hypothetical protein